MTFKQKRKVQIYNLNKYPFTFIDNFIIVLFVGKIMEQKNVKIISNHNKLKILDDPFQNQVLTLSLEKAYTGQQLAKMLEVARSKVIMH